MLFRTVVVTLLLSSSVLLQGGVPPLSGISGDGTNALLLCRDGVRLYRNAPEAALAYGIGWQTGAAASNTNDWSSSGPTAHTRSGISGTEQLLQYTNGGWVWELQNSSSGTPPAGGDGSGGDKPELQQHGQSGFSFQIRIPVQLETADRTVIWQAVSGWAGVRLLTGGTVEVRTNGDSCRVLCRAADAPAGIVLAAGGDRQTVVRRLQQAVFPVRENLDAAQRFAQTLHRSVTGSGSLSPEAGQALAGWLIGALYPAPGGGVDELATALAAQFWIRTGDYARAQTLISGLTRHWQQTNLTPESRLNGAALYPVLVADNFLISGKFAGSLQLVAALLQPYAENRFVSGRIMTGVPRPGLRRLQALAASFKKGALLMEIARRRSLRRSWWDTAEGLEKYLSGLSGGSLLQMVQPGDGWVWFHSPGTCTVQQTWYRALLAGVTDENARFPQWLDLVTVAGDADTGRALERLRRLPLPGYGTARMAVLRAALALQWQLLQQNGLAAAAARTRRTLLLLGRIDRSLRRLMSFRNLQTRADKADQGDGSLAALLDRIQRLRQELDYRIRDPFYRGHLLGLLDDSNRYSQRIMIRQTGIGLQILLEQPQTGLQGKARLICSLTGNTDAVPEQVQFNVEPQDRFVSLTKGDRPGVWQLQLLPEFYRHGISTSQLPVRIKITATWRNYGVNFHRQFYRVILFRSPFEYRLVRDSEDATGVLVVNRSMQLLEQVGLLTNRADAVPSTTVTLEGNRQTVLPVPYSLLTNGGGTLFVHVKPAGGEAVLMPVNLPDYLPLSLLSNWRWHPDEGTPLQGLTVADGKWAVVSFPDTAWPPRDGAYWLRHAVKLPRLLPGTRLQLDLRLLSGLDRLVFWNGQQVQPDSRGRLIVPLDLCQNGGYNRLAVRLRNPLQTAGQAMRILLLPPKLDRLQTAPGTGSSGRTNTQDGGQTNSSPGGENGAGTVHGPDTNTDPVEEQKNH